MTRKEYLIKRIREGISCMTDAPKVVSYDFENLLRGLSPCDKDGLFELQRDGDLYAQAAMQLRSHITAFVDEMTKEGGKP